MSVLLGTVNDPCHALDDFRNRISSLCTSPADALVALITCQNYRASYTTCGGDCPRDCNLLSNNVQVCEAALASCSTVVNGCECYNNFTHCIGAFGNCNGVSGRSRLHCCENQFICSLDCENETESVDLPDVAALFERLSDRFITLWNQALSTASITVTTATHESRGNEIVFTLTITFDELQTSLDIVIDRLVEQFAKTIGINADHLSGKFLEHTKRNIQSNGIVLVTATGANGSSILSVFLLPLILLNGLLYFLFN
jgi:hypothetical protein